jgi:hypothetical protein
VHFSSNIRCFVKKSQQIRTIWSLMIPSGGFLIAFFFLITFTLDFFKSKISFFPFHFNVFFVIQSSIDIGWSENKSKHERERERQNKAEI